MDFTGLLPDSVATNRDRFDMVEGMSGWNRDDMLRGDSLLAADMVGNELNAAGVARVNGLAGLLPSGATSFTGGNIIIGGAGSDLIEGRGGDDIIDGDAYLNARISVRSATNPNLEIETVDTLAGVQARVLAGTINPGQLRIVREILTPANGTAIDIAVFSDVEENYTVTEAGGVTTVVHSGGTQVDGTDTLRNIERLVFSGSLAPAAPAAPTATAGDGAATVNFTAPAGLVTSFSVQVVDATTLAPIGALRTAAGDATSLNVTGLTNGTAVRFRVSATNAAGTSPFSAPSNAVTPAVVVTAPLTPAAPTATAGNASALVSFAAPANGGSAITGFSIRVINSATNVQIGALRPAAAGATSLNVTGLVNGTAVRFQVQATNAVGTSAFSTPSAAVTPMTTPSAPAIGTATAGNASALVTFTAPANNGGSAVTGLSVRVVNAATNAQVGALRPAAAGATSLNVTGLDNGTAVRFQVQANNAVGAGAFSALTTAVTPVTLASAPLIGTATRGNTTALVRWTAPANNGGSPITGYSVRVVNATTGAAIGALRPAAAGATSLIVTGLVNGTAVRFRVGANTALGLGAGSALSNTVIPSTLPSTVVIGTASSGAIGGALTATARWTPPASNGGLAINGYVVSALRINAAGTVVGTVTSAVQPATARSLSMTLPAGNYRFTVRARNTLGLGTASARSNLVTAQ
jgi:hypothetical protein